MHVGRRWETLAQPNTALMHARKADPAMSAALKLLLMHAVDVVGADTHSAQRQEAAPKVELVQGAHFPSFHPFDVYAALQGAGLNASFTMLPCALVNPM